MALNATANPFHSPNSSSLTVAHSATSGLTTLKTVPERSHLPPINMTDQSSHPLNTTSAPSLWDQITQEDLEEPPTYSPRPDAYTGEMTVKYCPSRPFQPAPTKPHQPNSNWLAGPASPPPQPGLQSPGSLRSLINQISGVIATKLRNSAAAV